MEGKTGGRVGKVLQEERDKVHGGWSKRDKPRYARVIGM